MIKNYIKIMGCSNPKENLEDQIMIIKLKSVAIQMEREKNLKILSEIEGRKIDDDNLPEYLASRNVRQSHNIDIKYDEENNEIHNELKIENNNITNVTQALAQGAIKEYGLEENQNGHNNLSPNDNINHNNIFNQNESQPLTIKSKIIKKKIIKKKKRKISSQTVNNNNEDLNSNDINNL